MTYLHCLITAVIITLTLACSKSDSGKDAKRFFHKDIVIRETIRGAEQAQNMLLLKSSPADPAKIVAIASRGIYENEAEGFRFVSLKRDSGVIAGKSFKTASGYTMQFATCAALDKAGNIWVSGHVFGGTNTYGKPFVAKLSSSGELLFSKYYQSFDDNNNPVTFRSTGITALTNGDLLLTTYSGYGYQILRLSADGSVTWKKLIPSVFPALTFQNPFSLEPNLSNIINTTAELSDGSIVLHAFKKESPSKDYLIKLDAGGNLVFAKSYMYASASSSSSAQLIPLSGNRILFLSQKRGNISGFPYAYILSAGGEVLKAKGHTVNESINNPFEINEVKYIEDKVYLTTTGGYEFSTYVLDNDLSVVGKEKVLGSNSISTSRGGLSYYDAESKSMYHVLDVAGVLGDGNGFQLLKTPLSGKSCHPYSYAPEPLIFSTISLITADEPLILSGTAFKVNIENLTWSSSVIGIESQDMMCEE